MRKIFFDFHSCSLSLEGGDQFRFLTRRFAEPKEVHLIYNADHRLRGNEDKITEKATLSFIAG